MQRSNASPAQRRRLLRHLGLFVAALAVGLLVYLQFDAKGTLGRISTATAYASLLFLAVTLMLGPLRILRGRPSPNNTTVRRDVGIWSAILGLTHLVVGLNVHLRGEMWKYFLAQPPSIANPLPIRFDAFGVANHLGLAAGLLLLVLLALSNNASLRRLGVARWKSLQRWNYAVFALTALHGAAYQLVEKRALPWVIGFGLAITVVLAFQAAGFRRVRNLRGNMTG